MSLSRILLICLVSGLLKVSETHTRNHIANPNIIGGDDAYKGQFPYVVSVQKYLRHVCGGAILSRKWIITAAHCFFSPIGVAAVGGLLNQNEDHPDNQIVPARDIMVHPNYSRGKNLNDIALILLQYGFGFNKYVQPIHLPQPGEVFSGTVTTSGWGLTILKSSETSQTLQYLNIPIISINECNKRLEEVEMFQKHVLEHHHVCALPEPKQGICRGDSGNPLVKDGKVLVGVALGGDSFCETGLPNVFTRVSSFTKFIMDHIQEIA